MIGSILRPASYCGCVGYKPTVGGINRGGAVDFQSQSTHGVLAATLEDAWIVVHEIVARAGRRSRDSPACVVRCIRRRHASRQTLAFIETAGWEARNRRRQGQTPTWHSACSGNAGVTIVDRNNSERVAKLEAALLESRALSGRINNWEFRWPLNTFAHDMDYSKLSFGNARNA